MNNISLVGLSSVFYIANFHIGFSCGFCDVAWRCWDSLKIRFNDECKHIKCIDMLTWGFLSFITKSLFSISSHIPAINKYAFDPIEALHMTWAFCCQFIVEIHEWSSCCIFLSEQKLHVVDIFLRLSVNPRLV